MPTAPPAGGVAVPDLATAGVAAAGRTDQAQNNPKDSNDLPPRPGSERAIQAPFAIADPNERVAGMLREGLGRDRVERGMVDPYFRQLADNMRNQWKPEAKVDEKGLSGFLSELKRGIVQGGKEYMSGWLNQAEQYGKSGSPGDVEGPFDPDGRMKENLGNIPSGLSTVGPQMIKSTRIALVRLVQKPDGYLLHVELVRPSIDPAMDQEILRELRAGEIKMPVPPLQGQGIHDPIRSVWAFELMISIAPPAPIISGGFDIQGIFDKRWRQEHGVGDIRLPLSRRVTKRVELVSVD